MLAAVFEEWLQSPCWNMIADCQEFQLSWGDGRLILIFKQQMQVLQLELTDGDIFLVKLT